MKIFNTINDTSSDKPTLVFLSGLFAGGWMWDKTSNYDEFKNNKVVVMESALINLSKGKRNIENITEKVKEELINHDLTENLCFIGNSLGSLIGILISQDPSLKTSKLVLSGCPGMNKNINLGIGAVLTPNLNFGRLLVSRLFHNPEIITDEIINRSLEIVNTRLNFFKLIKIIQELDEYSVKDKIDDINIPTLLLWGENDNVTPVKFWADFPKKNKNISLSIIENCGHSPMMEQPTKFNKILNTFINN